jgi:hypothetical protein
MRLSGITWVLSGPTSTTPADISRRAVRIPERIVRSRENER